MKVSNQIFKKIFSFVIFVFIFGFCISSTRAKSGSTQYKRIISDITVNTDSTIDVVETITFQLDGNVEFIERLFLLNNTTYDNLCKSKFDITMCSKIQDIEILQVINNQGNTLSKDDDELVIEEYNQDTFHDNLRVKLNFTQIFDDEEYTLILRYKVYGAVAERNGEWNLVWRASDSEISSGVEKIFVNMHFPGDIIYSNDEATVYGSGFSFIPNYEKEKNTLSFYTEDLPAWQGYILYVKIPPELIDKNNIPIPPKDIKPEVSPYACTQRSCESKIYWGIFAVTNIIGPIFVILSYLVWKKLMNPHSTKPTEEFTNDKRIVVSPLLTYFLLNLDPKFGIAGLLTRLGFEGKLKIYKNEKVFVVERTGSFDDLEWIERRFMGNFFDDKSSVELRGQKIFESYRQHMDSVPILNEGYYEDIVKEELQSQNFLRYSIGKFRFISFLSGLFYIGVSAAMFFGLGTIEYDFPNAYGIFLLLLGSFFTSALIGLIIIFYHTYYNLPLSERGAQVIRDLKAYKNRLISTGVLQDIESVKKNLPFALALGVEKKYKDQLNDIQLQIDWFKPLDAVAGYRGGTKNFIDYLSIFKRHATFCIPVYGNNKFRVRFTKTNWEDRQVKGMKSVDQILGDGN